MSSLITVLYGVAALTGAAFAAIEFRMLWRFVRNRQAIRDTVTSRPRARRAEAGDDVFPLVTIQLLHYQNQLFQY